MEEQQVCIDALSRDLSLGWELRLDHDAPTGRYTWIHLWDVVDIGLASGSDRPGGGRAERVGIICFQASSRASMARLTIRRMLDDLGNRVDHTDGRLKKVTRTLNDFIRKNEGESCASAPCCFYHEIDLCIAVADEKIPRARGVSGY